MYVYIDESGPFAAVPPLRAHRISATAGLQYLALSTIS